MFVSKAVVSAVFLIAALNKVSTKPQSSIIRERHIIHAPIKFRVIHHYKIKKVPIIIKKHIHYRKPYTEKAKPDLEEIHANHVFQDDSSGNSAPSDFHPQDDSSGNSAPSDFHPQDDSQEYSYHTGLYPKDGIKVSVPDSGFHPQDDRKGHSFHLDFQPQDHRYEFPGGTPHQSDHDSQEEDYEDIQESRENYDEYDYE